MKYYIQRHGRVEGPLTVDEINSKLASGVIDSHWLATADLGESLEGILKAPERDWVPLAELPGIAGIKKTSEQPRQTASHPRSLIATVLLILCFFAALFFLLRFQRMFNW
jgi:hypothetical protein